MINTAGICRECGAGLVNGAKFCRECGAKVTEDYGETIGSEYYAYYGELDYRGFARLPKSAVCPECKYTYYKGSMYYVKNGYIWKSNEDGTGAEVVRKCEDSCERIFVNACGIYIIENNDNKIVAYDFGGEEKAILEAYNEVLSYYICDNRVFVITKDEDEACSAIWYDIDTQVFHEIYTTKGKVELGVNSRDERSYKQTSLNYIMGNQKRVLIWMNFVYNYYPEDEEKEDCLENESGGWYSYDFETGKFHCINSTNVYPHECTKLPKTFWQRWQDNQKNWVSIAYFDMKQDLMWTRRKSDGLEIWEPRKIGNIASAKVVEQIPSWTVQERRRRGYDRSYFDGKYRCQSDSTLKLYSYDPSGGMSSNIYQAGYQAADQFQVCGNYIFYVDDSLGYEKQFSLEYSPRPLRLNWMQEHMPERLSDEEKAAIDVFLNGKKRPNNEPEPESSIVTRSSTGKSGNAPVTYLGYWEAFTEYAFTHNQVFLNAKFSKAAPADRNWYALRFGTSQAHIELSFSTRKKTARTALFIRDKQKYNSLEARKEHINASFQNVEGTMVWDSVSKLPSIGIVREGFDISESGPEQYEWFMGCASLLKVLSKFAVSEK